MQVSQDVWIVGSRLTRQVDALKATSIFRGYKFISAVGDVYIFGCGDTNYGLKIKSLKTTPPII